MGLPYLFIKLSSSKSKETVYKEILSNSREVTMNLYKELALYDSLTTKIENRINYELKAEKDLINQKRVVLVELQKDFDSINLTPQQLKLLTVVTPQKENVTFREWITSVNQLYNIGVSLVISFFFYFIGRRKGKQVVGSE
jgi:hypothetical protein